MSNRKLWLGVAVASAAVLIFGSVQATGALWRDQDVATAGTIQTANLAISTGAGSSPNYTFTALTGTNVITGQAVQKPLTITNTGTAPLRFRMTAGGPSVSTTGATVTVTLAATYMTTGQTCADTGALPGTAAFTAFNTSATATTAAAPVWRPLAVGASETWCIRTTLVSVTGVTSSASYTHVFSFGAEST